MDQVYLYFQVFMLFLILFLHLSSFLSLCLPVARRRCARERLLRWFSRWWMEQMAVSSALDTPSWVTLTHAHRLQNPSKCVLWVIFSVCVRPSVCQSFTGPHLSERERRGLLSADAESVSVCSVCVSVFLSLSLIPLKLVFREAVLKRVRTPYCTLQHVWTHTCTGAITRHTHTDTFINPGSAPVVFIPVHASSIIVLGLWSSYIQLKFELELLAEDKSTSFKCCSSAGNTSVLMAKPFTGTNSNEVLYKNQHVNCVLLLCCREFVSCHICKRKLFYKCIMN